MLVTSLHRDGDRADFQVSTEDELCQDRLLKMGWREVRPGSFGRLLADGPDVPRIFENFSRHIEDMVSQSARRQPIAWDVGLAEFTDRAAGSPLRWWLYGSAALAVRGLDVAPGDVDIAVDDAHLAGALMADLLVEPVTDLRGWLADWGGRAFHGAIVEWLADAHPTGEQPPHEQEPAVIPLLETITWRGRQLRVPPLEVQLAVAETRGLTDRCALIRHALAV